MAKPLPPIPQNPIEESHVWREWFTVAQQNGSFLSNAVSSNVLTANGQGELFVGWGTNGAGSLGSLPYYVDTQQLADAAVTSAKIGAQEVNSSNINYGAIVQDLIASGAVGYTQFQTGLAPITIVTSLPTLPDPNFPLGTTISLTTDGNLYRNVSNTWTAAVDGGLIAANTITASQIAANTITSGQIAENTITAGQIAANTITAGQIAANTITSTQIAANTITASQIAAGSITSTQIAANTIVGGNIAAGTITAGNLVTATITAASAVIDNAAVNTLQIAGNAVTVPVYGSSTTGSAAVTPTNTSFLTYYLTIAGLGPSETCGVIINQSSHLNVTAGSAFGPWTFQIQIQVDGVVISSVVQDPVVHNTGPFVIDSIAFGLIGNGTHTISIMYQILNEYLAPYYSGNMPLVSSVIYSTAMAGKR